jgi:hypothetical protein
MKILYCFLMAFAVANTANATRYYVTVAGTAINNGTTWAAPKTLQTAIAAAVAGDEIWVAAGIYKPTTTNSRTVFFAMKSGVAVYGGFVGTEGLLTERNIAANATILSGA